MDFKELLKLIEAYGLKLLGGLAVLIIGLLIARWAIRLLTRGKRFQKVDPTVRGFLAAFLKLLLYAAVVLAAIGVMGVPLTSFVAILASAGVAVSLAMQGALSNLVGGVSLLLLKQIKSGEYIKVGEIEGTVRTVGMFYTELITADNRHVSMPNSSLTNTSIINYTREGTRRLDIPFSIAYGADIGEARRALLAVCNGEGVLEDPAPQVLLDQCADSGLNVILRLWCRQGEYWNLKFALAEQGKLALDAAGIEIPFPQMDVHMK